MIFMTILLVSLVAVLGVALYVSRTVDHGEARFNAQGEIKQKHKQEPEHAEPASRIRPNDQTDTQK